MAKKLTQISVSKLKPGPQRREVSDGGSGLYYVLQPSGRSSWASRYRFEGKTRKLTHEAPSLAAARAAHAAAMVEVAQGRDPATLKVAAKPAASAGDTIERLFGLFMEVARRKTRPRTWQQCESIFRREVLPQWGGRLAADIGRKDVRELIRAIAQDRPIAANRAQAYLSRFFKWAVSSDYIPASPVVGLERPAKEEPRTRALDDAEICRFWQATETLPEPLGDVYKMLLLSAARRQEIADLTWEEVNLAEKHVVLAAERVKGKRAVALPLGPEAWRIIEKQRRVNEFVFGRPRIDFGRYKPLLDAAMQPTKPWRNHDLRRTARTLLARARVQSDIAEQCLGHALPGSIRRTYDVFDYLDDKRRAFAALEREIDLILHPAEDNVLAMRA